MASLCQRLDGCPQPQIVEAMAMLKGIWLAASSGLVPASLESDALGIVEMVTAKDSPPADVGVVINDILCLLQLVNVSFISFVPRIANSVAHALAKLALQHEGEFIWLEDCPLSVENLVLGDCPDQL